MNLSLSDIKINEDVIKNFLTNGSSLKNFENLSSGETHVPNFNKPGRNKRTAFFTTENPAEMDQIPASTDHCDSDKISFNRREMRK